MSHPSTVTDTSGEPLTVLVGRDLTLGGTLASIAEGLARRGHVVVRAPATQSDSASGGRTQQLRVEDVRQAGVIIVSSRTRVSAELLAEAPRLRGIVFPSIGIESCDLAAATRLGVIVANGATRANVQGMAEATVMLMAALRLGLVGKQRQLRSYMGSASPPPVTGHMMSGSVVGLIGFGRIAREVTRRLDGWQVARILAHTRSPPASYAWPQVHFVTLPTLLSESDVVSLHLPLTASTRGILGASELETMKPNGVLINSSRGGLVDELALARSLQAGRLAGAAIDTFAVEPPPADHPLMACENVILTRHNVGHTHELFDSLADTAIENVTRIIEGRPPLHICNPYVLPEWHQRIESIRRL